RSDARRGHLLRPVRRFGELELRLTSEARAEGEGHGVAADSLWFEAEDAPAGAALLVHDLVSPLVTDDDDDLGIEIGQIEPDAGPDRRLGARALAERD